MGEKINSYCSWCYKKAEQRLYGHNLVTRNIYRCSGCHNLSVQCRYCQNMAKTGPNWDDECCAEHDGTIASFERLGMKIHDLSDFLDIFEREKVDLVRGAKIVGGTLAGVAVFAPLAVLAAPGMAAALGATGMLGAAGTGTAIATLHGAALTSASLAAIGGGTMAAGTVVVTAAGAALGAYQGGVVGNNYFGSVDHFNIKKVRSGGDRAVVFVNGFLSENDRDVEDWTEHFEGKFSKHALYHVDWEARNLRKLGGFIGKNSKIAGAQFLKQMAERAAKQAPRKLNPIAFVSFIGDMLANPWHGSMVKAAMTGVLLAEAVARTQGSKFTLMGHSLGARVIYYALEALSTQDRSRIENVYLLGGAVGGGEKDEEGWEKATSAVSGKIYNCFSKNDKILEVLYRGANGFRSDPIGYAPISLVHEKIFDFDCTDLVHGHMNWKKNLGEILYQLTDC